jgi:hypothetical protein
VILPRPVVVPEHDLSGVWSWVLEEDKAGVLKEAHKTIGAGLMHGDSANATPAVTNGWHKFVEKKAENLKNAVLVLIVAVTVDAVALCLLAGTLIGGGH